MRAVLALDTVVVPLLDPVDRLARAEDPLVADVMAPYFRDVHDHLLRVAERVRSFRELLTNVLTANLTKASVQQNEDVRKISAWVAIIAVPTMIAGIYGMNFEHMPELKWSFGYPASLAVMLVICVSLYRYFRRSGWL